MARKPILPLLYIIASIFIVNNCQGQTFSSLLSSLLSNLSNSISRILNFPFELSTCRDDIEVQYPLIIKKDRSCLTRSSPPKPLEFYIKKDEEIETHSNPDSRAVFARLIDGTTYLTGGLLKDEYKLYNLVVEWKNNYTETYTVGNITNPYGLVRTFFLNEYYNSNRLNCSNSVALTFYIDIGGASNPDPRLDKFLKIIKNARNQTTTSVTFPKTADFFEYVGETIFKKPYYLYKNVTTGFICYTAIVFSESILISQSQFDENFGTSDAPSQNKYTPQTNDTKTVYYITGGIKIMNISP